MAKYRMGTRCVSYSHKILYYDYLLFVLFLSSSRRSGSMGRTSGPRDVSEGSCQEGHGLAGHGLAGHSFTLCKSHTKGECFYKSMPNFDTTLLSHPVVDLPVAS
jgi:hypothetical protein